MATSTSTTPPRRGRPATAKRVAIGTYIRPDVREALRRAAFQQSRPLCEVLEEAAIEWCARNDIKLCRL